MPKKDKKTQLVENVKTAVRMYGIEGVTTRNISDAAGINDSHLYRFYKNKEELLLDAYIFENSRFIEAIIRALREAQNLPVDMKTRVRFHFHKMWREFLDNPDSLRFCVYYYHSANFSNATGFHDKQVKQMCDCFGEYFSDNDTCIRSLYVILTFLYDGTMRYIMTGKECTDEDEEKEFNAYYALLCSFSQKLAINE